MDVEQTALPGIGLRHEFTTRAGRRIGVVSYRTGRRDLVVYDPQDPDRVCETVKLNDEEADALVELLGAPRIVARLNALHREVEGLVSLQVPVSAQWAGRPMGDAQVRTQTGASIVAIVRSGQVNASPAPDFVFAAQDVVVVVGSPESTEAAGHILAGG
ncbi:potassium/proton antiporter regulatory subunit (CPA2 family) [Actinocorallia herbida]|uniref:Potassium/proton antiporter regulatory subunit (CPA2 family) n=1 Tax=Actinocorallia herbida TaxID=58109 RepID=A0A3N1D8R5_9ACTN|nr:cation:proton antiporter regulatory subunit [Actinocorallia herbida]ROO89478.1 potassium/proton antiporter regulatory subunit (CPA2 family) [Actinocorallia herbida]